MKDQDLPAAARYNAPCEERPSVREWLEERRDNCLRIAEQKTGSDKEGWMEDAVYFAAAAIAVMEWSDPAQCRTSMDFAGRKENA